MKNKSILPDTCAWIDYFRPGSNPIGRLLEQVLATENVYVCGPVLYELVQGVKSEKELAKLTNALGSLPFLEMTETLWVRAGKLSAAMKKVGKTIPLSDILIAILAIEHNLAIITVDEHFHAIPGITVYTE